MVMVILMVMVFQDELLANDCPFLEWNEVMLMHPRVLLLITQVRGMMRVKELKVVLEELNELNELEELEELQLIILGLSVGIKVKMNEEE